MLLRRALSVALLFLVVIVPAASARQADDAVVRAVMFFSPTCGHCEFVIQEVFPPLFDDRGGAWDVSFDEDLAETGISYYLLSNGTVEILLVDVTVQDGFTMFAATTEALVIGNEAVPRLVISNQVMIGSQDIPNLLPGMIDDGLATGGIDWPDLPGMVEALATIPEEATFPASEPSSETTTTEAAAAAETTTTTVAPVEEEPVPTTIAPEDEIVLGLPTSTDDSIAEKFGRDQVANTIAVIVLVGMLVSLVWVFRVVRSDEVDAEAMLGLAVPIVATFGLLVAAYLAYVEVSASDAVCGPLGDCQTVQQSDYASIFGIPIGVIGLVGYAAALGAWLFQRGQDGETADRVRVALFAGAAIGVVFSIYLTFLEPFVIGATCAWCLSSAIAITALMWLSLRPGLAAWRRLRSSASELEEVPA